MDDTSQTANTARRLSCENWKIFESWRKERKELKDFQAHYVRPHAEMAKENYDNGHQCLSDCESVSSCGHTACIQLSFNDDASVSRYESCIETARSSLPVIQQESEDGGDDHQAVSEYFDEVQSCPEKVWHEQPVLISPKRNKTFEIIHDKNVINEVGRSGGVTASSNVKRTANLDKQNGLIENHNTKLTAAVNCLLSIEPLKKYFRGIIYHGKNSEQETVPSERYSTLEYMVKVFRKTRRLDKNDTLREIQSMANECSLQHNMNETCFEKLKGMLGELHEEIILAKHNAKLKRTCLRRCKLSNRSNHSIVSHIFRGHLKKKAECPCGHKNIIHDPFTSVPLFSTEFDEKTLVIPMTWMDEKKQLTVTKYLVTVNQYTTIKDLKSKLCCIDGYDVNKIAIASVKFNDIKSIHQDATAKLFDAMCTGGDLHAFAAFEQEKKHINNDCEGDDELKGSSTSALTDESSADEGVKRERNSRCSQVKIPFVFRDDNCEAEERMHHSPVFVQLSKAIIGNEITNAVQNVLDIVEMHRRKIFTTVVDVKTDACLVCCEPNCTGCYLQAKKCLNLDKNSKVVAYIPPNMQLKTIKIQEHKSLATGIAASVQTIEEGIAAFCNEDCEINCIACGDNQFVPAKRTVISYPDVLVLTINRHFGGGGDNLVFPYNEFMPVLSKSSKNRKQYDLSGLITSRNGLYSRSETAYVHAENDMNNEAIERNNIEMLIYTNIQYSERRRIKKASSSLKIKRKGKLLTPAANRVEEVHPMMKQKSDENYDSQETPSPNPITKDDETASTCSCSRCQCWEKCAEQIRSNEENPALGPSKADGESQKLKKNFSPLPNLQFQLQRAIFKQDLRRVVSLLKKGANPNELVNGSSALHIAAGLTVPAGYLFTKLLIDHGADVHLKSALGQTAIQFAASFGRSETVRLLGYHGADLSEAEKIDVIRNAMSSTSIARDAAITPQDSPLAKRYFDESDNEDDSYTRTMINLKKSIGMDHQVIEDGSKCLVDDKERLRNLSVKAITEKLYPNANNNIESHCDAKSDTESLVPIELTDDLRVSDLSVENRERILEWQEDTADVVGCDETDNMQETKSDGRSRDDVNESSPVARVRRDPNALSVGFDLSAIQERDISIEYTPKSHINTTRQSWFRFMCCGMRSREKGRRRERSRMSALREYFRLIMERILQRFNSSDQ